LDTLSIASTENHTEVISRFDQISSDHATSRAILDQILSGNIPSWTESKAIVHALVRSGVSSRTASRPQTPQGFKVAARKKTETKIEAGMPDLAATFAYQTATFSTVRLHVRRQSQCHGYCSCICHSHMRARTPSFLKKIIGTLLLGYSGMPLLKSRCSNNDCRSYKSRSLELTYCFPQWFLERAVYLVAASTYTGGPMIGLTVRRRTEYAKENSIFQMAIIGHIDGIRELLGRRLATPNDVDSVYGETALFVS
jgi:hypothetical protein